MKLVIIMILINPSSYSINGVSSSFISVHISQYSVTFEWGDLERSTDQKELIQRDCYFINDTLF